MEYEDDLESSKFNFKLHALVKTVIDTFNQKIPINLNKVIFKRIKT